MHGSQCDKLARGDRVMSCDRHVTSSSAVNAEGTVSRAVRQRVTTTLHQVHQSRRAVSGYFTHMHAHNVHTHTYHMKGQNVQDLMCALACFCASLDVVNREFSVLVFVSVARPRNTPSLPLPPPPPSLPLPSPFSLPRFMQCGLCQVPKTAEALKRGVSHGEQPDQPAQSSPGQQVEWRCNPTLDGSPMGNPWGCSPAETKSKLPSLVCTCL